MGMVRVFCGVCRMALFASYALVLVATVRAAPKHSSGSSASRASTPSNTLLDTAHVRRLYLDGDFDEAIDKVETSLRYGSGHTHIDSVFAFKHLGVMYAAKYETREKGKQYMHRLLEVEPTARILDMYASDMIYMIFKNIKDEFDAMQPDPGRPTRPLAGDPRPSPGGGNGGGTKPDKAGSGGIGKAMWIGGACALAAAGAATWYILSDDPRTVVRNSDIK